MYNNNVCPKIIIGCDPSYSHFGLTIIDRCAKDIRTYDIETSLGKQDFYNICIKSKEQVKKVVEVLTKHPFQNIHHSLDVVVGMENALPYAFNSVALTALDVMLYHELGPIRTAQFNPTYLNFLMGKHTKHDSINLALGLISIFEKHGYKYSVHAKKKITDGEAESFIYASRMLCKTQPKDDIVKDILELQPLFSEEKEKYSEDFIYKGEGGEICQQH